MIDYSYATELRRELAEEYGNSVPVSGMGRGAKKTLRMPAARAAELIAAGTHQVCDPLVTQVSTVPIQ